MTNSTSGRGLAMLAGTAFVAGALAILFEDVIFKGAPFALKHGLTIVILFGTIMTGHLTSAAWSQRHWLAAAGFALVFVTGTALVVYTSVGRQAETSIQTTNQIEKTSERRVEIKRDRQKSQAMLNEAQNKLDKACKGGDDGNCKGVKATIAVYKSSIAGYDAALEKLGSPKIADPEAEQLAEVAAVVLGADKPRVKAAAILVVPFLRTILLEFGSVVCFGFGFRPHQKQLPTRKEPEREPEKAPRKTWDPTHPVLRVLHSAGRPISNDELAERMGVTKSQATKRRAEVAGQLLETRSGRTLQISLQRLN